MSLNTAGSVGCFSGPALCQLELIAGHSLQSMAAPLKVTHYVKFPGIASELCSSILLGNGAPISAYFSSVNKHYMTSLEHSVDKEAWQATVFRVTESDMTEHKHIRIHTHMHTHTHTHAYTHTHHVTSSVLKSAARDREVCICMTAPGPTEPAGERKLEKTNQLITMRKQIGCLSWMLIFKYNSLV